MSTEERKISLKGVLASLHSGKTRDQINTELELTKPEARVLWSHPQLKGRKTTPVVNLAIEDDLEEGDKLPAKAAPAVKEETASELGNINGAEEAKAEPAAEAKAEHKTRAAKVATEAEKVEAIEVEDEADSTPWNR